MQRWTRNAGESASNRSPTSPTLRVAGWWLLPSSPTATAPRTELDVEGMRVVVIGLEDLLLDRLRAAVHWQSPEDRRWARRLVLLHAGV